MSTGTRLVRKFWGCREDCGGEAVEARGRDEKVMESLLLENAVMVAWRIYPWTG